MALKLATAESFVMLLLLVLPLCGTGLDQCSQEALTRYPGGWPSSMDVGIYWVGPNDATEKATSGEESDLFDPSRKTVIYFHGWTGGDGGWTESCKRVTGRCPDTICPGTKAGTLMMEQWLQEGWNVGLFYWDQFADEPCARDAEQKIWFDRKGDGLRWKSFDPVTGLSRYHVYKDHAASVADMCVSSMQLALGKFSGSQVRFVGHSIGAQLAVRCAALLHKQGHQAAPRRLALLEPYFSKHHLFFFRCKEISTDSGLGDFTADAAAEYVKTLQKRYGVVTEVYKSSMLTRLNELGSPNEDLERLVLLVQYRPSWCGSLGPLSRVDIVHLKCRHIAVFPMYFLSLGKPVPHLDLDPALAPTPLLTGFDAEAGSALRDCATPSAACSDGQIQQWMDRQRSLGGAQFWTQVGGRDTFETQDDTYRLSPSLDREVEVVSKPALGNSRPPSEGIWTSLQDMVLQAPIQLKIAAATVVVALLLNVGWRALAKIWKKDDDASDDSEGDDSEEASTPIMSDEEAFDEAEFAGPRHGFNSQQAKGP